MRTQLIQALRIEMKVMSSAAPLFLHQADRLQRLQMLRYGGTRHRQLACQFAYRRRALPQQIHDGLARWMRKAAQQLRSVSHTLR